MGLLLEILVVAIAVWVAWRGFRQHQRRVADAVQHAEEAVKDATPETLVKDPKTGVYRPKE
jgi:ABC-type nickel/cobalt efflux system permease component RcnA